MKSILIPPIPHLDIASEQKYHLLLSHLMTNVRYRDFYAAESMKGSYLILDNSAHELKSGQPVVTLLTQALDVLADEIVIPDTLFNGHETARSTERSLLAIAEFARRGSSRWIPRLMVVAQGKTFEEFETCFVDQLVAFQRARDKNHDIFIMPPVFGVSKDYNEMFPGKLERILADIYLPACELIEADIHLLGWCGSLWDLVDLERQYGDKIRTCDSARPFVYGANGIWLERDRPFPTYPHRASSYFQDTIPASMMPIVERNITVFREIVEGIE